MNESDSRPIVCGTDFSEPAEHAADVAAALAKRLGTQLLLVHGIDERGETPPHHWPRLIETGGPLLKLEADRLRATGVTVEERLVGPVPDDGVAKRAEEADAQMIVLASSGMSATRRWLIGSISERIAETARLPTLIVHYAATLEAWLRNQHTLKIFVGADFTRTSEEALRWVGKLAKIAPCAVTVGYITRKAGGHGAPQVPEMHEILTHELRDHVPGLYGTRELHVQVVEAADRVDLQLMDLAREASAELIVIGTHQWYGFSRLRYASVSRRILHEARTNVACVPAPALVRGASAPFPKVRRVLATTDLSTDGGHTVPHAFSMLEAGGAVRIVHVVEPNGSHQRRLAQLRELVPAEATRLGIHTDVEVIENLKIAGGICEAAERFDADLICIGSKRHSEGTVATAGSVAQAVIALSRRPVLVVRPSSS